MITLLDLKVVRALPARHQATTIDFAQHAGGINT